MRVEGERMQGSIGGFQCRRDGNVLVTDYVELIICKDNLGYID